MFNRLDHIAIAVSKTEEVLPFWTDVMGFSLLLEETVANGMVRLTHLTSGDFVIQLVQPLTTEHPISKWIQENGDGLHHFCFLTENFDQMLEFAQGTGLVSKETQPHQGTEGKRAIFLDKNQTSNTLIEVTGY